MGSASKLTRPEILESTGEESAAASRFSSALFDFTVRLCRLSRRAVLEKDLMPQALGPILKTLLFTILVPGIVTLCVPYILLGRTYEPGHGPLAWLGVLCFMVGACIYFSCAWEFAVRGLGTPAPIAPTKFLVVSGLHRYVRNPMYIGVLLVILGQAALFHAPRLAEYAVLFGLLAHLFVLFYEEPTLRGKFGDSYEEYRATVPRWIPRLRK
jgi:protein-S-isoprenylcysteine O-methyltransferase Ste14